MARPASSIGRKWESGFQDAISDAEEAYGDALHGLATKVIAAKETAKTNFAAALDSTAYDAGARAGLASGVANIAFTERLAQIAETGFTTSQHPKMVAQTELRSHLPTPLGSLEALATRASGKLKLDSATKSVRRIILTTALMELVDNYSTTTTATVDEAVRNAKGAFLYGISMGT